MQKQVLLTAEHHNWGLSSIDDWQQTKYILYADGALQSIIFENGSIYSSERQVEENDLKFIKENIRDYVLGDDVKVRACDGDAWKFEGADFYFDLGYIYGTELEKIAAILTEK